MSVNSQHGIIMYMSVLYYEYFHFERSKDEFFFVHKSLSADICGQGLKPPATVSLNTILSTVK